MRTGKGTRVSSEATDTVLRELLPADPRSAREARQVLRSAVADRPEWSGWAERAELAVTELVTNAVVHAGTDIELRVRLRPTSLRVEVEDGTTTMPARRTHSATAATGRGLHLLASSVDRWDVEPREGGKTVWFELGDPMPSSDAGSDPTPAEEGVEVRLLRMPLLMHWAWQEHAAALLREYLLVRLDEDPDVLEQHAEASAALGLLYEQVPAPVVAEDPEAVMASAVEPAVTADVVVLRVPRSAVAHFETLDLLLRRARELAEDGALLGASTQPEAAELRAWVCHEVLRQAGGDGPTGWAGWTGDHDPGAVVREVAGIEPAFRALASTGAAVVATDEASVVVAVSPAAVAFLGYDDEADLLGRRVTLVIPPRFHQAHVAGTTLHHTNGRSVLLGVSVTVPVVRADGTEAPVRMSIEPQLLADDLRAFVARFHPVA